MKITTDDRLCTYIYQLAYDGQEWWISLEYMKAQNEKSFPSHKAHKAALISVSLALNQTPVHTARPQILEQCIARCACLRPSFRW